MFKLKITMVNDIIKPDYNYTPVINSDTVISVNKTSTYAEQDAPLRHSKYLSEFQTLADKVKVRQNIDVYSKQEVYNKKEMNNTINSIKEILGSVDALPNQEGNIFERINYLLKEVIKLTTKNLLINSSEELNGTTHYRIKTYALTQDLQPNANYTFVVSGSTSNNQQYAIYTNDGNALLGMFPQNMQNEVQFIHITTPSKLTSKRYVFLYNYPNPNGQNKPCHVEWAALYKGHIKPPMEWQ